MGPRFQPGARVRVLDVLRAGHIRTPTWLFGKYGVVESYHGAFPDAEKIAYHAYGLPPVPLYFVSFNPREVWGEQVKGSIGNDKIYAELYEHWLHPA